MTTQTPSGHMAKPEFISLCDGRKLCFARYGALGGVPVIYLHGAGSSRIDGENFHLAACSAGVQIFATDRPGCGGSSPDASRSFISYANDLDQLADKLGIGRFVVAGQSNGGVYAMAAASSLKDRVTKAIPINASTPMHDALARKVSSLGVRVTYALMGTKVGSLLARRGARGVLNGPKTDERTRRSLRETFCQENSGYLEQEVSLCSSHWGFDHTAIAQPVDVFTGVSDAGYAYAKVWAERLPIGTLHEFTGGHVDHVAPEASARIVKAMAAVR